MMKQATGEAGVMLVRDKAVSTRRTKLANLKQWRASHSPLQQLDGN